ncbi:hypothetical protein GPECTOR_1g451 [Gonium pectorale]|uniref:Histone deacetylase domain-containing protein n=1 Tax=Gonium pectorale TaxID=33097 RepID=A0A150H396_GONPE|nr:hypothetical protein GPECTOR_1g451 [Gonium pectorale]|eukprot:KXZ56504.1 hypothetical protein GPECTOR_1g451 [Gonium pectorale]
MGGTVLPSGASAAIPIAIAGVGASGRVRATTVHAQSSHAAASVGAGLGATGSSAAAAFRDRSFAQSVDHHFMQQHLTAQAAASQHQFFHASDGGAPASSPAHFVGSVSPSCGPSFQAPAPFPCAPADAANTASNADATTTAPPPASPSRPADGLAGGWQLSHEAAAAPVIHGQGSFSHSRNPAVTVQSVAEAEEDEDEGAEADMMDGANSLASSGCGQSPQRILTAAGGAGRADAHPHPHSTVDEDGDEEFEDAVEVQHDNEQHVYYFSTVTTDGYGVGVGREGVPVAVPPPPHAHTHPHGERMRNADYPSVASPDRLINGDVLRQHGAGSMPMGGGVYYNDAETLEDEEGDEDEEASLDGHMDHRSTYGSCQIGGRGHEQDLDPAEHVLDEEDADEGEEEEEDEPYTGGAAAGVAAAGAASVAGWGAGGASVFSYAMPQHTCANCTRRFFGPACRSCGQLAGVEVVAPEVLAAAVQCMEDGAAATAPTAATSADRAQAQTHAGESGSRGSGVLLAYDDRCRTHMEEEVPGCTEGKGRSHPERPERVAAIMARLQGAGLLTRFERILGREATTAELVAAHDPNLVSELEAATEAAARQAERAAARRAGLPVPEQEESDMGMGSAYGRRSPYILDCYFNASTAACARLAAGSAAEVARRVVSGAARHGAAIIRPPGHHAETSVAMGFCYYNNAAVAARAAQAAGARRVLIMDWDVHHGNGTQRIFYDDPSVLYISTHRFDHGSFYPGTGDAEETGEHAGVGFTVNVPWNCSGVRDVDMLAAFRHVVMPVAEEFRPDLVVISAGFDAVEGDPLGGCRVTPAAFGHFAAQLSSLAPAVLLLEGGYNLTATAAATEACLRVLLGEQPAPLQGCSAIASGGTSSGGMSVASPRDAATAAEDPWVAAGLDGVSESAVESLRKTLRVQSQYWQAAREHHAVVEAAVEHRRRRELVHLQVQDSWGWRMPVTTAPPPSPPPLPPPSVVTVAQATEKPSLGAAADGFSMAVASHPSPQHAAADGHTQLPQSAAPLELEGGKQEPPRQADISMAGGSMDYGEEQLMGMGDTHMY